MGLLAHDSEVGRVLAPGHPDVVRLARVERPHLARACVDDAEAVAGLVGGVHRHREPRALLTPGEGPDAPEVSVHTADELADDEVGAVVVALLAMSLHREVGAVLAERKGVDALDLVRLTADQVEQAEVVLDGLLPLREFLPLGFGLANREGQPLAVARERWAPALLENLRGVGRDHAQSKLAGVVVSAD